MGECDRSCDKADDPDKPGNGPASGTTGESRKHNHLRVVSRMAESRAEVLNQTPDLISNCFEEKKAELPLEFIPR